MGKYIVITFILLFSFELVGAQSKLSSYEDSLNVLGNTFMNDSSEIVRTKANYQFIQTLVKSLKEKYSYNYPFKSLNNIISIKNSEDNKFRILSWFTQSNDGKIRYYGAIQMNNPAKLELYPLVDNTQTLKISTNLADTTLLPNQWLGAVYYQVIPVTNIKNPYYLLLGWKGYDGQLNGKIIETLTFVNGKPQFGVSVLPENSKDTSPSKRLLFDYTKSASMLLRYVKEENLIVFDHLVKLSASNAPIPDLMAPDLSYDGLRYKGGRWVFQDNLKLQNLPDEEDEFFIDPSKDTRNTNPVIKD